MKYEGTPAGQLVPVGPEVATALVALRHVMPAVSAQSIPALRRTLDQVKTVTLDRLRRQGAF